MTTSVDTSYGSWPATTPPFITKYGVVTNPSTSFSTGVVLDPYGAPPSLFINGEQGVWYDPSDFSTMFQDSVGTTPVTAVEQPVGLMLDKSKGLVLGPELVTNGDFSNGLSGWGTTAGTLSIVNAALRITSTDTAQSCRAFSAVTCVIGKTYRVTGTLVTNTSGRGANLAIGNGAGFSTIASSPSAANSRTDSFVFTAQQVTQYVMWSVVQDSGSYFEIDNISVKELPGNHATQATSTKRPVLSARVNLLTKTEDFSDAVWLKGATTATANELTILGVGYIRQAVTVLPLTNYVFTFKARRGTCTQAKYSVYNLTGSSEIAPATSYYNLINADTYTTITIPFTTPAGCVSVGVYVHRDETVTGTLFVTDAQLGTGSTATRYQRVNTATDYDTVGFKPYLKFDGVDDALATASIDFTATDKMTVVAGVRKLSDAATAVCAELSASAAVNVGVFALFAPRVTSGAFSYSSGGTTVIENTSAAIAGAVTKVLTAYSSISAQVSVLRVSGVQTVVATPQGTGNYGNYPLYIGSRGGTTLPFNGHLYSLIIRGAQSTDAQIVSAENYVNGKTNAY